MQEKIQEAFKYRPLNAFIVHVMAQLDSQCCNGPKDASHWETQPELAIVSIQAHLKTWRLTQLKESETTNSSMIEHTPADATISSFQMDEKHGRGTLLNLRIPNMIPRKIHARPLAAVDESMSDLSFVF